MAEFKAGDRVVKMSGAAAGKYGTVNSVRDDGTLNVTFDGERLPRFCDPERCGKVAANAKFKVGDKVLSKKYPELGEMKVVRVFQDIHGTAYRTSRDGYLTDDIHYDRTLIPANSRAANAVRNERIRAYPDGPGEWILVDSVGDEGIGRTTATDERGIKAQLADIAVRTYRWHRPEIVIMREKYYSNAARNAGRFELVEHNMGRSFGVYDSATSGYIADDIPLRDALRILKTKGETAEQAKKDLDWTDPAAIDRLW